MSALESYLIRLAVRLGYSDPLHFLRWPSDDVRSLLKGFR